MFRRTVVFVCVLFLAGSAFAQLPSLRIKTRSVSELQADQRTLIGQWCRMDFEGARLSSADWTKFDPLTSLKSNPDFSAIYVITRYQMVPPDRVSMQATVSFNVIGRFDVGMGYTPMNDMRYVDFKFAEKDGDLQITDLDPSQPNVSKAAFIAWLKTQIASTSNDLDKLALKNALEQLVPPPPKPKPEGSSSSKPTS